LIAIAQGKIFKFVSFNSVNGYADAVFFVSLVVKNLVATERFVPNRKEFFNLKVADFF
jgi:hypothetical protein